MGVGHLSEFWVSNCESGILGGESLVRLKKVRVGKREQDLADEFQAELAGLVDDYQMKGLSSGAIQDIFRRLAAELVTAVLSRALDLLIKAAIVVFCTATPVVMMIQDKHEPYLYGACLLSILAVVMQFFDLDSVADFVLRLKKGGIS